jgi:mRNA-degrading endonuclease RelE of RelBE toxin-antitoxin system
VRQRPVTVVETAEFVHAASGVLAPDEVDALKLALTFWPTAGVVIPGTGGLRKLRWGAQGKGKRGGARVITYFHDEAMPLFLVTVYAKSKQADIPAASRRRYAELARRLVATYRPRRR